MSYLLESGDASLNSLAHSCNGHLIKRVITQNPQALTDSIDIAGASVINGLVDTKPSVVSSCINILNDCWMACPEEMDTTFKRFGLSSSNDQIQIQCLDILARRVETIPNFSFKIFTPSVVKLLNSPSAHCANRASEVLIQFFKGAKDGAKEDLAKELSLQAVSEYFTSSILHSIGFKSPSRSGSINTLPSKNTTLSLNIDFLLKDPLYTVESLSPEQIFSADSFKRDVTDMMPVFEGKETEFNWQQREKHILRLRAWLRGNASSQYLELLIWAFKYLATGILKAAQSLRTTLSSAGCQLVKEVAIILGNNIDTFADTFLSSIIKMTALSKKITHSNANITTSAIIANTSYSIRTLNHIQLAMNEKNIQPRLYSGKWLRIILYRHRPVKSSIESSGGRDLIENCISKGISDASPGVREEMRQAFWAFNEVWPVSGQALLNRLDGSIKKALERSNPQPSKQVNPTNVKAVRAGSSSIKDFIAQSRERNSVHPIASRKPIERMKVEKVPKDLSAKAARLGISQRAQRRIPPSTNTSTSTSQRPANAPGIFSQSGGPISGSKPPVRDLPKISRKSSDPHNSISENLDDENISQDGSAQKLASAISEDVKQSQSNSGGQSLEDKKESQVSIADQIRSEDSSTVLNGVLSIVECWKGLHGNLMHLPSPSILGRFFKDLFSASNEPVPKDRWELIHTLTHPTVVSNLMQFVPVTEIALGSIHTHSEGMREKILQEILKNMDSFQERSSLSVYVISSSLQTDNLKQMDSLIELCFQVLKETHLKHSNTPSLLEDISLLGAALNLVSSTSFYAEKYKGLLDKISKRVSGPISKTSSSEISSSSVSEEIFDTPLGTQPIEGIAKEFRNTDSTDEIEKEISTCQLKDVDNDTVTPSESMSRGEASVSKLAPPVTENDTLLRVEGGVVNKDKRSQDLEKNNLPPILDFDDEIKTTNDIEIFQDKEDTPSSCAELEIHSDETNEINWLKAETESKLEGNQNYSLLTIFLVNACSDLTSDFESSGAIPRLLDQLYNRTIQFNGLNKLISLVRDLDSEAMVEWKEIGWFGRLKSGILRYFDVDTISELTPDQANRGLLLLNHLLIIKSSLFLGEENKILNILLAVLDIPASDKRHLIKGTASVREELLGQNTYSNLLQVAFDNFEVTWNQPSTSTHHKVFLLSTIIAVSKGPLRLDDYLVNFNNVILAGLKTKDAVVRKHTYPVLLHLINKVSEKELLEEKVMTNLKEGEKKLLEYYQNNVE